MWHGQRPNHDQPIPEQFRIEICGIGKSKVNHKAEHQKQLQAKAEHKLADLAAHTKGTDQAPEVDRKRAIIEAALAKAKARQTGA